MIKSQKFVTLDGLNFYINGELTAFEKSLSDSFLLKNPKFVNELRVSVGIDRKNFKSLDGMLFSYNPKYLDERTNVVIFMKILDKEIWDKYNCESILKSVFEIGFGKKKSSGYGQFEVLEFNDFNSFNEPEISNGFVSLSHILPSNKDKILDAFYNINVKYGKFGEEKSNSQNPFKKPLIMLTPGSCFITDEKSEFYGRAVTGISDYFPNYLQNGIAFTLKAKL
jgi:CRISPR-associated protein Csm4